MLAVVLATGCASHSERHIGAVSVSAVEWGEGEHRATPRSITLAVEVRNDGPAIVLRKGRARIAYNARRVLMFTLDDKVRIPRHFEGVVEIGLRVNVVHNSQSMALRAALARHDVSDIDIDWDILVRSGLAVAHIVQPAEPVGEVVSGDILNGLWRVADSVLCGQQESHTAEQREKETE